MAPLKNTQTEVYKDWSDTDFSSTLYLFLGLFSFSCLMPETRNILVCVYAVRFK